MRAGLAWLPFLSLGCTLPDASDASDGGTSERVDLFCFICVDAASDATVLQKVQGVLGSICANPDNGCHGSGGTPFTLSSGTDFDPLIDVASVEMPSLFRVKRGDPAHSYVYLKVACEGGIDGSCMPPGAQQTALATLFHDWIEAGAPTQ